MIDGYHLFATIRLSDESPPVSTWKYGAKDQNGMLEANLGEPWR